MYHLLVYLLMLLQTSMSTSSISIIDKYLDNSKSFDKFGSTFFLTKLLLHSIYYLLGFTTLLFTLFSLSFNIYNIH